jgi:molybdate transport system permease protein
MVPALLATLLLVVPLVAMVAATNWAALPEELRSEPLREALWLSLTTSTAAVAICLLLGLPLSWLLARADFPGRGVLRALVTVPLVLPPVVAGVALRTAFGRTGVLGEPLLAWTGFAFPFTTWGVVLAHVFVSMPFVVIAIEGALRSADPRYDEAAATLGATRWTTFRRVTVPLALPGVVAGTVLGWARSLGEFGATITFAGSLQGVTRTLPLEIYLRRETDAQAAVALSLVLVVVAVVVIGFARQGRSAL